MGLNIVTESKDLKSVMRLIDLEQNHWANRMKDYERRILTAKTQQWERKYKQVVGECAVAWDALERLKELIIEKAF